MSFINQASGCRKLVLCTYYALFSVPSSHADTHLVSDRGDTCSASATCSYRQQDLEEKDDAINQSLNYEAVCRTSPATAGLLMSQ